jgi:hypothetical protein
MIASVKLELNEGLNFASNQIFNDLSNRPGIRRSRTKLLASNFLATLYHILPFRQTGLRPKLLC